MSLSLHDRADLSARDRDWLIHHWKWMVDEFGVARIRNCQVVLPTNEFFPNIDENPHANVEDIFARISTWMEIDANLLVLKETEETRLSSTPYLRRTAGLYVEKDGTYQIVYDLNQESDTLYMAATFARQLGYILLSQTGWEATKQGDLESLAEFVPIAFGLGVITANAVLKNVPMTWGHFSSGSVEQHGYLSVAQMSYVLALFAMERREEQPEWVRALRPDVRQLFSVALVDLHHNGLKNTIHSVSTKTQGPLQPTLHPIFHAEPVEVRCTYCDEPLENLLEVASTAESVLDYLCPKCEESIRQCDEEVQLERDHQKASDLFVHRVVLALIWMFVFMVIYVIVCAFG